MKLLCSFLMLQEKVMDCWWESLAMMLWSWKKIAWRSTIWLLHVHLNLHVAKMIPSLPSPCSHLPPKPTPPKKKREKKRKKGCQCSTNGRGEETITRYFFCLCRKWGSKSDCARLWDQMYWNASSTSLISSICFSAVMWVQRSAAAGQEGVECAKATSDLRALDILKVKPNHLFWKHSYSFKAPSWKPGSILKGQGDSLSQIKHLILLKSSCERCLCIVCSFPVGISW